MHDLAELGFWGKKIVSGLILVPCGPLLVVLVGVFVAPRRPRAGLGMVFLGTLVLFVLAMPVVANSLAAPAEQAYPPLDPDTLLPRDAAIVVLGGGLQMGALDYGGETVNPTTLARLRSAARLAKRSRLPVLVTGGRPPFAVHSEAALMADAMTRDFGVPVRWVEDASLDTDDNARRSAALLAAAQVRTVVLVTDVEHVPRARSMFETQHLVVIAAPTDYHAGDRFSVLSLIPNPRALLRSSWAIHEWVGMLWARLHP